jgi:Flp pilus assembly protein TadD
LLKAQPTEAGWWIAFAYATRRSRSIEAARRILLRAEKQFPSEPTIQFNLACYAARIGEIDEARSRLTRAVSLEPGFAKMAETDPDLEPIRSSNG